MGAFPQIVADAAKHRTPHRIANYIQDLAATFHSFYNAEKVLNPDNKELTEARLALINAVRIQLSECITFNRRKRSRKNVMYEVILGCGDGFFQMKCYLTKKPSIFTEK